MKRFIQPLFALVLAGLCIALPVQLLELIGTVEEGSHSALLAGNLLLTLLTAGLFYKSRNHSRAQVIAGALLFLFLAAQQRTIAGELGLVPALLVFAFAQSLSYLLGTLFCSTPLWLRLVSLPVFISLCDLYNLQLGWGSWHLPTTDVLHFTPNRLTLEPVTHYLPGPLNPAEPSLISLLTLVGACALILTITLPTQEKINRKRIILLTIFLVSSGGIHVLSHRLPSATVRPMSGTDVITASKKEQGELYVVVLTGPLNRNLLQAYGFPEANTPWLTSRRNQTGWLFFDNAYASLAPRQLAILPALQTAGLTTHWLEGKEQGVLPAFAATLKSLDPAGNHLVFLCLDGNRLPDVDSAAPQPPSGSTHLYGKLAWDPLIRASLARHNDQVRRLDALLSQLQGLLEEQPNATRFLLIAGAAGDDPISGRPPQSPPFNWERARIPLIVWASEAYRSRNPQRFAALTAHRSRVFTSDGLGDLLLGVTATESDLRRATHDLSSSDYRQNADTGLLAPQLPVSSDPLLAVRSLPLDDPLVQKITVHRVNTLGRLAAITQAGLHRIELDVNFRPDAQLPCGGELEVMHRWQSRSWTSLETFLRLPPAAAVDFFWVDGKNLDAGNAEATACLLERIEALRPIKQRLIIETYSFPNAFARFAAQGWRFSGLPGAKGGAQGTDAAALKAHAARIAAAIKKQGISDISFRAASYGFIKKEVEPLLPTTVNYHIQEKESIRIDQPGFLDWLHRQDYAGDERVKTLLFDYETYFFL